MGRFKFVLLPLKFLLLFCYSFLTLDQCIQGILLLFKSLLPFFKGLLFFFPSLFPFSSKLRNLLAVKKPLYYRANQSACDRPRYCNDDMFGVANPELK